MKTTREKRTWGHALASTLKRKPTLELEWNTAEDGEGVWARLVACPDSYLMADTIEDLYRGFNWLCTSIIEEEQRARRERRGTPRRLASIGMQGQCIEGEFLVRFLACPGWGVCFTEQARLQPWLAFLTKTLVDSLPRQESL